MTDEASRLTLADDIKQLRKFTYDGNGGNQARQAIDRLEAVLTAEPLSPGTPVAWAPSSDGGVEGHASKEALGQSGVNAKGAGIEPGPSEAHRSLAYTDALEEWRAARQDVFDNTSKISSENTERWKRLSDAENALMDVARASLTATSSAEAERQEPIWPTGCHSPNSCDRNGRCMYVGCKHDGADIRKLANDAKRPAEATPVQVREAIERAISDVVSRRDDLGYVHFVEIRDAVFAALTQATGGEK